MNQTSRFKGKTGKPKTKSLKSERDVNRGEAKKTSPIIPIWGGGRNLQPREECLRKKKRGGERSCSFLARNYPTTE